jgi:hypothetical protein
LLGANEIEAVDASAYQGASIVHDLKSLFRKDSTSGSTS